MNIFITGASGFVGSAVLRRLIHAGHTIRAMVRRNSDRRNLADLAVDTFVGDITDPLSLDEGLRGCEALFHVAADYRLWVPDPARMYETNVNGTREIMIAAIKAGIQRIVYTSSVATLGLTPDGTPAHEETPATLNDMVGHYKRSKYLAEGEVRRLAETENLPVIIVNPSTPIGPRDIKPTPTGRMVLDAAAGRMPAYVDTGLNIVHVDDVAEGHLLAFERGTPGRRYILGGENLTLNEILNRVASMTGRPAPKLRLPHNLILPLAYFLEGWARLIGSKEPRVTANGVRLAKKRMYFSSKRARYELGYQARPVDEALQDAVDWFLRNGYLDAFNAYGKVRSHE
jgi:dihydroflavonol-4-reductase